MIFEVFVRVGFVGFFSLFFIKSSFRFVFWGVYFGCLDFEKLSLLVYLGRYYSYGFCLGVVV